MRRLLCVILTVCCIAVLPSCAEPANEGVLIIPSSNNPVAVTETEEPTETKPPLPEETSSAAETDPVGITAPDTAEASDVLAQAQQLLRDEAFLAILAQYGGQLSPDAQTAVIAAVLAYQRQQGIPPVTNVTDDMDETVVYWTAGGSVWHVTDGCSALAKSKSIVSGSETQAMAAGKTRVCKRCDA